MKVEQISDLVANPSKNDPLLHTREKALSFFENFKPGLYAKTRNFLDGHISRLSIWFLVRLRSIFIAKRASLNLRVNVFSDERKKLRATFLWLDSRPPCG